ncbi:hypothetical protein ACFX12_022184 [Malus domestica]
MESPTFCSISILPSGSSVLSSHSFASPPPLCFVPRIRRKPCTLLSGAHRRARHRRRARRKLPPENDMSVAVPMPSPTRRLDLDDEPFLNSRIREMDVLITDRERAASMPSPSKNKHRKSSVKIFGVELCPDNVAVAMVYFVQGVLGLARLAVSFYLKDDLHLDPAETAVISGFSALPWLIKPVYGFISDSVPLFGYRRRSYLILSGLLGAVSWSLMATVVDSKFSVAFCIILGSLSVAFSDVVSILLGLL